MPKSFCGIFFQGLNAIQKKKKKQEANSASGYTKQGVNQLRAVRDAGFIPRRQKQSSDPSS